MNKLNLTSIILGGALATAILILLFLVWRSTSQPRKVQKVNIKIEKNDQVKGARSSDVILVEYSDFQCPACGAYYPIVKEVTEKYKNKISFVYRHFPLSQHKNAEAAASAAEAAGLQGKFWQMHDILFEKQEKWSPEKQVEAIFVDYVKLLKIDVTKFKKDIKLNSIKNKIADNQQSGISFGVNATPTFFLNGIKLENPRGFQEFDKLISDELKKTKN